MTAATRSHLLSLEAWIVDLEGPRLEVLTLADGAYGSVEVTDVYTTSEPFDVTVDPTRLG